MYAVILAGGVGERFWPLSRRNNPKQFLPLVGPRSMLQLTVDRLSGFFEREHIFVVTSSHYSDLVKEQIPWLSRENIINEPWGRNTAAAIGLAGEYIRKRYPEGIMAVLPADHYIADVPEFQRLIKVGAAAAASGEWMVTLGIKPSRPETGFGYIEQGEQFGDYLEATVYRSERFHEKPDLDKALEYLQAGKYLWNSGMFIWRTDVYRSLVAEWLPELDDGLRKITKVIGQPEEEQIISDVYGCLPSISVDYGIVEKSDRVLVIPSAFGWDDVGTWTALERFQPADSNGNVVNAQGVVLDSHRCMIYAPHRVIAVLGVKDLLIVDEPDSLLICPKDRSQEIKQIVKALDDQGYGELL